MPSETASITTIRSHRDDLPAGRLTRPRSLTGAIDDRLLGLPPQTRAILQMLAVLDLPMPLALLGQAAQVDSPSAAIEPAVAAVADTTSPRAWAFALIGIHEYLRRMSGDRLMNQQLLNLCAPWKTCTPTKTIQRLVSG